MGPWSKSHSKSHFSVQRSARVLLYFETPSFVELRSDGLTRKVKFPAWDGVGVVVGRRGIDFPHRFLTGGLRQRCETSSGITIMVVEAVFGTLGSIGHAATLFLPLARLTCRVGVNVLLMRVLGLFSRRAGLQCDVSMLIISSHQAVHTGFRLQDLGVAILGSNDSARRLSKSRAGRFGQLAAQLLARTLI